MGILKQCANFCCVLRTTLTSKASRSFMKEIFTYVLNPSPRSRAPWEAFWMQLIQYLRQEVHLEYLSVCDHPAIIAQMTTLQASAG